MTAPDIALFLALCFFGIAFLITGIIWWRREGVSAERAASLCVMSGIVLCLCAVWWAWGPTTVPNGLLRELKEKELRDRDYSLTRVEDMGIPDEGGVT